MLFISDYPNEETIKDGMLQRVKAIDKHFEDEERTYLHLSFHKNISFSINKKNNLTIVHANVFAHPIKIFSIVSKERTMYFHSIYNVLYLLLYFPFLQNKKMILDVHGAVPEEQKLFKNTFRVWICTIVESIAYKRCTTLIVVTHAMKEHLTAKYAHMKPPQFIIYPILPDYLLNPAKDARGLSQRDSNKLTIVYAGNTQSWQNVELMIEFIKEHNTGEITYYILSGEKEKMKKMFEEKGLGEPKNIIIDSVRPDQLSLYYSKAHYGFVLRDNITVNNVACPTKLVEYMYYGIIPIVKTEKLGDFSEKGYEYVHYHDFKEQEKPNISEKNKTIIKDIIDYVYDINLKELIR